MDPAVSDREPSAVSVSMLFSRLGLLRTDEKAEIPGPSTLMSPAPRAPRRSKRSCAPDLRIAPDRSSTGPNLPELLACDLEISSAVFALQSMTAGQPSPELATPQSTSYPHIPSFPQKHPYRTYASPMPLVAIHEARASADAGSSASDVQRHKKNKVERQAKGHRPGPVQIVPDFAPTLDIVSADLDDFDDFDDAGEAISRASAPCNESSSSEDHEPPSIRFCEQSVITAATSLSSASISATSRKALAQSNTNPSLPRSCLNEQQSGRVTPPSMRKVIDTLPQAKSKRHSRSFSGQRIASEQRSDAALEHRVCGPRRVSLSDFGPRRRLIPQPAEVSSATMSSQPLKKNMAKAFVDSVTAPPSALGWPQPIVNPHASVEATIIESDPESENEDGQSIDCDAIECELSGLPRTIQTRLAQLARDPSVMRGRQSPTRPLSSHDNVQTWLDTSVALQAYSQFPDDAVARGPPLPPDVFETLRISTSCFPETVLRTSSLSIETIRSYGRKVKWPLIDSPLNANAASHLASFSGGFSEMVRPVKKWSWSRMLPRKNSSASPLPPSLLVMDRERHVSDLTSFDSPASTALPWWPLRSVFGPCVSDYLLDALFAHLVAYNYIAALCPLHAPCDARTPMRPVGAAVDDSSDIPRKAANLLGLFNSDLGPGFSSCARPGPYVPPQQQNDGTLRALKTALGRCIGQLVSTIRVPPQDEDGDELCDKTSIADKPDMIDVYFFRSLCEIVRCCEAA